MEIRDYAKNIVEADKLEAKLAPPPKPLTDDSPGEAIRILAPGRPENLRIVPARQAKVPSIKGLQDPIQKVRILHSLGNHELQAVELFAWALLAFPQAPYEFRQGLLKILREEQMHCRLYERRLQQLDHEFGDFPVSGYFWNKIDDLNTPSHFVCAMGLTFENANIDHSAAYAEEARAIGDTVTAELLDRIHRDEIGHVRFGWKWLGEFKPPEQSMVDAYREHTVWPLRPALARGESMLKEPRLEVGMDAEFIRMLEDARGEET